MWLITDGRAAAGCCPGLPQSLTETFSEWRSSILHSHDCTHGDEALASSGPQASAGTSALVIWVLVSRVKGQSGCCQQSLVIPLCFSIFLASCKSLCTWLPWRHVLLKAPRGLAGVLRWGSHCGKHGGPARLSGGCEPASEVLLSSPPPAITVGGGACSDDALLTTCCHAHAQRDLSRVRVDGSSLVQLLHRWRTESHP